MNFNDLKEMINNLLLTQEDVIMFLSDEIDDIIKNNVIDDKEIEKLFDNLLNLIQTDEVLNLYKKLGEYYYKIHKELVIDYYNIYNEMYLEDDEKILIKL